MATHYDVLGVPKDATLAEIKRAYLRQARLYHPDNHAASVPVVRDEAERSMQRLNAAWTLLQDPARRRRYDKWLDRPVERKGSGASHHPRRGDAPKALPALGTGFQPWLGNASWRSGPDGRAQYNLRVAGATTLQPLAQLAPDRLFGLHAAGAAIGDYDLVHLRGMTSLRILDLTGTAITDAGLLHLLGCTGLETLWLWNTQITDGALDLVARLPALRQLGLGNTAVTDAGLVPIGRLRTLRLLQLWG
ncbi:MAG TPA: DnaJ domain-containing protein, partial [Acidimicrobiales bacterium]